MVKSIRLWNSSLQFLLSSCHVLHLGCKYFPQDQPPITSAFLGPKYSPQHHPPLTSSLLGPNIPLSTLLQHPQPLFLPYRNKNSVHINIISYTSINPLNAELNPICHLLALLGFHHFLHVSRIRVKSLTLRLLMSYIYGTPILDVSRSHTTHHSR